MTKECKCNTPVLKNNTRQCGKCNLYIERARHILLTNKEQE